MQYLQAASRRALAEARERLDSYLDEAAEADAERLGEELFAAVDLLSGQPVLRRHLADPSTDARDRTRLLGAIFGGKLSQPAMQVLEGMVAARWSQPRDLMVAAETLGRLAVLAVAQRQGAIEDVEDELFRAGRLIDREPRLRSLLADLSVPAAKRVELLRSVLAGKVHPTTERLLVRAVQAPHGISLDRAAEQLADLAAERRQRSVARVRTPVALTDDQQERLAAALSRIYGRGMSLQIELDEELIGGLVVRVGDEVIDGSLAGRLAAARQRLPR
ncbi:MAG TPA: F0F1 ATP synthase subunit delta [Pseudonocardiaceae bacterium]|jgi:F-type H+-transporting ATPase subunit delta